MVNYLTKPWLLLPPEFAHNISPTVLNLLYSRRPKDKKKFHWSSVDWEGLHFRNPVGTAGGLDKNGVNIKSWWNLGAGFLELGTVTPLPQFQNEGVIIDRDKKLEALWNCMGFPNLGARNLEKQLLAVPKKKRLTPLFVNIGKNRWTPNETAHEDYVYLIKNLGKHADSLVINISSPNTKGLRDLFSKENFRAFLNPISDAASKLNSPPLLLKISPDLEPQQIENIVAATSDSMIKGWILTNTTVTRSEEMKFPTDRGGVSGKPLNDLSKKMLVDFQKMLGSRRSDQLIISTGGISGKADVSERLDLGADLVQVYSTLVFNGPGFFKSLT